MRMTWLGTLFSLLVGCAPPMEPKLTFHGDVGFNADERACMVSAASQWGSQTDGLVSVGFVWDYDSRDPYSVVNHALNHKVTQTFSHSAWTIARDAKIQEQCRKEHPGDSCTWAVSLGNARGEIQSWPAPIEIHMVSDRIRNFATCKQVAMHELGHAFGMDHTGNEKDVMFPQTVSTTGCLTTGDLTEFCRHNFCGTMPLKGCE